MEKQGTINFPPFIPECSNYIGRLRDLFNSNMNEENERFKRGDRSEYVNVLGVQGELIFSYYLQANNIPHKMVQLLSNKPVSTWDILVGNTRIDVKTIRTDAPDLLVNKEAHLKCKGIDNYVFIQILNETTAQYWVFKYEEVSAWDVKNVKYTDAYYYKL